MLLVTLSAAGGLQHLLTSLVTWTLTAHVSGQAGEIKPCL